MDEFLQKALGLLTDQWQPLSHLKRHYTVEVWETLVYYDKAVRKIELIGRFKGCRHYYKRKEV